MQKWSPVEASYIVWGGTEHFIKVYLIHLWLSQWRWSTWWCQNKQEREAASWQEWNRLLRSVRWHCCCAAQAADPGSSFPGYPGVEEARQALVNTVLMIFSPIIIISCTEFSCDFTILITESQTSTKVWDISSRSRLPGDEYLGQALMLAVLENLFLVVSVKCQHCEGRVECSTSVLHCDSMTSQCWHLISQRPGNYRTDD